MMSEVSQGYGWWQAADLKWYPPELHADYVPPRPSNLPPPPKLPSAPKQPPVTKRRSRLVWLVLAGLILLPIVVLGIDRLFGTGFLFLLRMPYPILYIALVIALIIAGVTIEVRSRTSSTGALMGAIGAVVGILVVCAILSVIPGHSTLHQMLFHERVYGSSSGGSSGGGSSGGAAGLPAGQAKIMIGGQVLELTGPVRCTSMGVGEEMFIGGDSGVMVMLGRADVDPPPVDMITFGEVAGVEQLRVEPDDSAAHATAAKHGNSYTFTGTATGLKQYSSTEVTREFEIDLTCP
jgi:lipoprotein antigen